MDRISTLFCLVHGEDPQRRLFSVEVSPSTTISDLRKLVKIKKSPRFDNVAADELNLWKVHISQDVLITLDTDFDFKTFDALELLPMNKIQNLFSDGVPDNELHIIVQVSKFKIPEGESI